MIVILGMLFLAEPLWNSLGNFEISDFGGIGLSVLGSGALVARNQPALNGWVNKMLPAPLERPSAE